MTAMPMGDLLRHHMARKPADAVALTYPDAALTWSELEARTNRLARCYAAQGVGRGDHVAIALGNSTRFHEAAFAIWKLGATPATLSPRLSKAEFEGLLALVRPRLLVTDAAEAAGLGVPVVGGRVDTSGFDGGPLAAAQGDYWKISSSGGSTGRPKVIIHAAPPVFDPLAAPQLAEFGLAPGSVVLNPGPLYHNAPFLFSSWSLFSGGSVVGMDRFDPEEALRLIQDYGVTWVCLVPTMMHRIWSLPAEVRDRYDVSSLRVVWHMASVCPAWLKEAWIDWLGADRLWERYGGTEGFGSTSISGPEWLAHRGSVGRVVGETRLKIVGDDGAPCAPGEVGELYFKPAGEQPPSYYVGAEARRDAEGYFSLGDLGHQDADGYVWLADRRTDLIIRGGANIYPAEVEAALDQHPAIGSSIVIGLPCDELGARVHAILQLRPEAETTLEDVHRFLRTRLVAYKLPESYELVHERLRDDAGKARRSALRAERIAWMEQGRPFRSPARALSPAGS